MKTEHVEEEIDLNAEPVETAKQPARAAQSAGAAIAHAAQLREYGKRVDRAKEILKEWPVAYPGDVNQVIHREFGTRLDHTFLMSLVRDARAAANIDNPARLFTRNCLPLPSKYRLTKTENSGGAVIHSEYATSIEGWKSPPQKGPIVQVARNGKTLTRRLPRGSSKAEVARVRAELELAHAREAAALLPPPAPKIAAPTPVVTTPDMVGAVTTVAAALAPLNLGERKRVIAAVGMLYLDDAGKFLDEK